MITLTQEQRARLSPVQLQRLEAALTTYAETKTDLDLLSDVMDTERATIGLLLEDAGVEKADTEFYTMCWVRDAETSSLDKKKLISMGVTTEMLEQATVRKPKKPYFQIRAKSQKGVDKSGD